MNALWLVATVLCQDKVKVGTTLPVLEAIVREVGGEDVEAFSLAKPDQDPHFVSPTPVLMKKIGDADLFVEIGMGLEAWADDVANGSGNTKIGRGGAGRVVASAGIPKEEVPTEITRAAGDLHAEGNPHLWLDPVRAKKIAGNVCAALCKAAPAKKEAFEKRLADFDSKIDKALFGDELLEIAGSKTLTRWALDGALWKNLEEKDFDGKKLIEHAGGWVKKARPLRGVKVAEFHKVWVYASKVWGFEIIGTIEEKPGIPPGPRYQREITERIKQSGARLILVDSIYPADLSESIAGEAGAKAVVLPNQCAGTDDYVKFVDGVLDKMLEALK